jgi:hypothetical protein
MEIRGFHTVTCAFPPPARDFRSGRGRKNISTRLLDAAQNEPHPIISCSLLALMKGNGKIKIRINISFGRTKMTQINPVGYFKPYLFKPGDKVTCEAYPDKIWKIVSVNEGKAVIQSEGKSQLMVNLKRLRKA